MLEKKSEKITLKGTQLKEKGELIEKKASSPELVGEKNSISNIQE